MAVERGAAQKVRDLLRQAERDPIRAQALAVMAAREMDAMIEAGDVNGVPRPVGPFPDARSPATRILRVPGVPLIDGGVTSAPRPMDFSEAGIILAMYGTVVGDGSANALASISVNVRTKGGDKNLVSSGDGEEFLLYAAAFPATAPWFPLLIKITEVQTTVTCVFRNEAAPGDDFIPALYFSFIDRATAKALGIWPKASDDDDD